jgi:hypothetical protein
MVLGQQFLQEAPDGCRAITDRRVEARDQNVFARSESDKQQTPQRRCGEIKRLIGERERRVPRTVFTILPGPVQIDELKRDIDELLDDLKELSVPILQASS